MNISYEKLWAILKERGISRTELVHVQELVQMQWQSWAKMKMYEFKY